jgi:hypothetical protein
MDCCGQGLKGDGFKYNLHLEPRQVIADTKDMTANKKVRR